MLLGILVKPLVSSSTIYIIVPKIIHITTTLNIKTNILVRLLANAFKSELDSPTYRVSFSILNTLNNLKALKANKDWVPTKKSEIYLGTVDTKSIIPYGLRIYFSGLLTEITLRKYSIEKTIVITHSEMFNKLWCLSSIQLILSRATSITLESIKINKSISKTFPAGVSAS